MNTESKELYINMGNDIPVWNDLYTYEEQDDDVKQFWENEAKKLTDGVTINGVFIHPWLYWHINFWKMMVDKGMDRVPGNSELRDNEWMFAEFLKQAEEENKGIFMFGCRRFGKALLNSEVLYLEDREKYIGDIVVGDRIYDDRGKLSEVIGVYPQGKVTTYRVVFEDGRNVICCGNHVWKVKVNGQWSPRPLKSIISLDYTKLSIPIGDAVEYATRKLPIAPSAYGSMIAAYLSGYDVDIYFDKYASKKYLRSSPDQKKRFIESFIVSMNSVVTGEEEIDIPYVDKDVIQFVQKMFWSFGWYAKFDGKKLILSANKKELKIRSISVYGKELATCITVDNNSHLFLTTNYIVTHNTAVMSSLLARNATMTYNLVHNVIGSSKEDLASMGEYLEFGLDHLPPFLSINRTGNDWSKEVIMGTRSMSNQRDIHARIRIMNVDDGKSRGSLKTAGGTPYTSIYDEVGKFPVLGAWLAGRPAHMMNGRMRGICLMSGCCCAGTIVYKANGEPCKIEDLKPEDGIVGFDDMSSKAISQDITWMKPPAEKECYRITTKRGRTLECSGDHPILTVVNKRSGKIRYKGTDFRRADSLKPGRNICISDGVDIWGNERMFDPYLVGLLIGDGSYGIDKTPIISTSDDEVYDYIQSRYECCIEKQYKTKVGKNYREIRIKGICHELRKLGIYGQTKKSKTLPLDIHSYRREDVVLMLRGYFDADATFYSNEETGLHRISVCSCNKDILEEVVSVLFKFGIHGKVNYITSRNPRDRSIILDSYICNISDKISMMKFCDIIGTGIKYRSEKLILIRKFSSDFSTNGSIRSKHIDGVIVDKIDKIEYIGIKPVYNLTASNTHTYIANGIITHNTGGNVEKSQDAQKIMNSPDEYGFIIMNYDLLNKRTSNPTWRICKSGCFVPAQMSHAYAKKETTLDEYLKVDNAPGLKKIKIKVSDFDKNTEIIKGKLNELVKKDRSLFVQERMAFPLSIDDCFLNANVNRFPVEDALIHKSRLLEEGRPGKTVDIYQTDGMKMGYHFSDKQLASYPFGGGNIDAPVVIYEDPPENGGIFDFTYVSGCLLPGSEILTKKGWVNIELLSMDDSIIDKEGKPVELLCQMFFEKKDTDAYIVEMTGTARKIRVTHEHPFYISEDRVKKGKISEDQFNFDYNEICNIKEKSWTKYPNIYKEEIDIDNQFMINGIDFSMDLWWLVGLWVGDGSFMCNETCITVSKKEEYILDRLVGICNDIFHVEYNICKNGSCNNFYIKSKELTNWLMLNFGKGADGKYIPEWAKRMKHEFKISLIHGYFESDGCVFVNKIGYATTEFVSINLPLLESLQHILFSIGVISSVSMMRKEGKMIIEGREVNTKNCYHLRIAHHYSRKLEVLFSENGASDCEKMKKLSAAKPIGNRKNKGMFFSKDEKYIYIQIRSIKKFKYSGIVYNLHDTEHNYLLMNLVSKNCDPYKSDKADTDSLGAFYVLKRHVRINDPFAYRIVASYISRPPSSDDFCRNCEILQEAYGAKCLMENADRMYEMYLSRRNKELMLLEDGEKLAGKIIRAGARQNNKLGLSPTVPNQRMLFNTVLQYCWEEEVIGYDDDGNEITQKGIYRIPDIELLDEIISFGPGVNTDRIIAFGHALLLAKYYDDMGYMPESTTHKENEKKRERRRVEQVKGFSVRRHNPFKIR